MRLFFLVSLFGLGLLLMFHIMTMVGIMQEEVKLEREQITFKGELE